MNVAGFTVLLIAIIVAHRCYSVAYFVLLASLVTLVSWLVLVRWIRRNWFMYCLGDMIRNPKMKASLPFRILGKWYHRLLFPESIASKYMRRTTASSDYETLTKILRDFPGGTKPRPTDLVVHLRVGDVIDYAGQTVPELLSAPMTYSVLGYRLGAYVKPLEYYHGVAEKMSNHDIRTVILVYGSHLGSLSRKSKAYVSVIAQFFRSFGYEVYRYESEGFPSPEPDQDFWYMCGADFFCPSGGGFSRLVAGIVKRRGRLVLGSVK